MSVYCLTPNCARQAAHSSPDQCFGPGIIEGVGPETPTRINEFGAGQSDVPYRFDLIDAPALFEMAKVLDHGARKYGEGNWHGISVEEHLNHLIMHAYAYLASDEQDDHLSHVLCRATFALGVKLRGGPTQQ